MRIHLPAACTLLLINPLCFALATPTSSISNLVVFGDSLSDNGNAAIALGGNLGNYAPNAFTDGLNTNPQVPAGGPQGLWIDQLAPKLGVADPVPALAGGQNYSVASALTGHNPAFSLTVPPTQVPYTTDQVALFSLLNSGVASSTALYTFWAGSNDLLFGSSPNPIASADNIYNNIESIAAEGGKFFMWLNLPLLGITPLAQSQGAAVVSALDAASAAFNAEWSVDLQKLQAQGINVVGVNIQALYTQIAANPAAFGFTNLTNPAQGQTGANPDQFLFWDSIHPTTAADALIANAAFQDFEAVPEPSSLALALAGLCGLVVLSRARRKQTGDHFRPCD